MKKLSILFSMLLLLVLFFPLSTVQAGDNGVDDLRGRWDLEWDFFFLIF